MRNLLLIALLCLSLLPSFAGERGDVLSPRGELQVLDLATFKGEEAKGLHDEYTLEIKDFKQTDTVYRAGLYLPLAWTAREAILRLDSADAPYAVEVGGKRVAMVTNANIAQEINLSDFLVEGDNELVVRLFPSHKVKNIEAWKSGKLSEKPIGRVRLMSVGKLNVRDVVPRVRCVGESLSIALSIAVENHTLLPRDAQLKYALISPAGAKVVQGTLTQRIDAKAVDSVFVNSSVPIYNSWSEIPHDRYELQLQLYDYERVVESYRVPLAFRDVEYSPRGTIILDGKEQTLRATRGRRDMTANDLRRLRFRDVNTLLIGVGTYPEQLLKLCDSIGFFCIVTAPIASEKMGDKRTVGGNASNDPRWFEEYLERVSSLVLHSHRHPSVIGFALGERSANGYNLYEVYHRMKKITGLPIIYQDVDGEWNSDKLNINYKEDYGI